MRRIIPLAFLLSLSFSLLAIPSVYAGGLESTKAGTQKVVDAALQPGTYEFVEKLVKVVGDGIDWYFDRLVIGAEKAQVGPISNSIVDGMGQGFVDLGVTKAIDQGLDSVAGLGSRFWLEDFKQNVLQASDVKVQPYFKGGFEYNSNVFLEPEAPKTRDEALWTWTPGVSINFPFGDNKQYRVGAVYEARITEFTKYDEHDDVGQSLGVIGDFKLTDALYVNVTEELVQDAARAGTRSAKRVEYNENKISPTIGYNWRDWTFEGKYWNAIRDFDSSTYRAFSYANNGFTTTIYRTIAQSFRGLLDYTYSHYDYAADETRVGQYNQIRAGVTGQLSQRTNLLARVGYQDREYRAHDTEFHIPVWDIRLTHRLTQKANLDFYFERSTQESAYTNNRAYDEKLFQASGNYLFNQRFRGRAGTAFVRREFENEAFTGVLLVKRRDIIGRVFVGLDYIFRPWLIVNLDYKYDRSNSNNSNFDYTNNQLSLGMTMPL